MPLGTLDRTPPPFFRQGPSALTKLLFFSALAVFLMVADARFRMTEPLRAALATALLPVQRTLLAPVQMLQRGGQYLGGLAAALEGERAARAEGTLLAERAARAESLALENALLRSLMDLQPALEVRSLAAEVMFEAPTRSRARSSSTAAPRRACWRAHPSSTRPACWAR
jgi:rod shape-determining protein MreC